MLTEKEIKIKERLIEIGELNTTNNILYNLFKKELLFTLNEKDDVLLNGYTIAGMIFDEAISDDTTDLFIEWILKGDRKSFIKLKNWFIAYIKKETDNITPKKDDRHYIYIVQMMDENKYCKIGRTSNIKGRINVHKTSNPYHIKTIFKGQVKNAITAEARLQTTFKDKNIKKEWYNLDEQDIKKAIKIVKEEE